MRDQTTTTTVAPMPAVIHTLRTIGQIRRRVDIGFESLFQKDHDLQ